MNALTNRNLLASIDEIDRIIAECPTINEGTQSKLRLRTLKLASRTKEALEEAEDMIADLVAKLAKKKRELDVATKLMAIK